MPTTTPKVLIETKYAENALTLQYTATNCKADIYTCKATNVHASANVVFSVHIVPSSGSATAANRLLDERQIAPGESYLCPEITGELLANGDMIYTNCDTANAISMRISGAEITS